MRLEIIVFLVLLGIFVFTKYGKDRLPTFTLPKIGSLNVSLFLSKYILPILLFIALMLVMWLTDESLGWWSFFKKDWYTFTALVITYLIFASAFIQDKEKKAPFYQKVMVFAMIVAVAVALVGSPSELLREYGVGGTRGDVAVETIEAVATPEIYTKVPNEIPAFSSFNFICPWNTLMKVTHDGNPAGEEFDCDEGGAGPKFSELTGVGLEFKSKDHTTRRFPITITPRHV